ncbi:twin-arginine translocase TatA/TatE family subunit [Campylobacter concisus]|uniref:Sec-independent protein translocase protein TatA n=1 Tax=Campylobacter concisus TaxID=199 RepID=A0A1Y5MVW6_9BACT|nr:twin-arginine translocase TatA/TatE family subunit [Campylobacter concisus]OUT12469.1 twin-arginine translocase TatA/TatE family subunit [Campylobacter concisus]
MGSFSIGHWLVVLAIIVLLFGAKKIPELAKGLGKGIKTFKAEMEDTTTEKSEKVEHKEENADSQKIEETTKNA